jgi:hypothetical protein
VTIPATHLPAETATLDRESFLALAAELGQA